MPQSCPHCGITLPAVVDAFCPECREDLNAGPETVVQVPKQAAQANPDGRRTVAEADAAAWLMVRVSSFVMPTAGLSFVVLVVATAAAEWATACGAALVLLPCILWLVAQYRLSSVRTSVTGGKAQKSSDETK